MSAPSKRTTPWRALGPLFFARARYIEMAVSHALALCLEKQQFRESYGRGVFPSQAWEAETRTNLGPYGSKLARSFGWSFLLTAAFFVAALAVALLLGRVALDRPLDIGKSLSLLGAFLAGGARLCGVGGYGETFSGEQLHELLHPLLFRIVFLPGLALAVIGQVW